MLVVVVRNVPRYCQKVPWAMIVSFLDLLLLFVPFWWGIFGAYYIGFLWALLLKLWWGMVLYASSCGNILAPTTNPKRYSTVISFCKWHVVQRKIRLPLGGSESRSIDSEDERRGRQRPYLFAPSTIRRRKVGWLSIGERREKGIPWLERNVP